MRGIQKRKDNLLICERCYADLSRDGALKLHAGSNLSGQLFECVKCGNIISFSRENKYKSVPIWIDSHRFPSLLEGNRYKQLKLLWQTGEIRELKLQVKFAISRSYVDPATMTEMREVYYKCDFMYFEVSSGRTVVEDTKGKPTKDFSNKWRQCREIYPEYDWRILTAKEVYG